MTNRPDMLEVDHDDRDTGIRFFQGVVSAVVLTALFAAIGYAFAVITG